MDKLVFLQHVICTYWNKNTFLSPPTCENGFCKLHAWWGYGNPTMDFLSSIINRSRNFPSHFMVQKPVKETGITSCLMGHIFLFCDIFPAPYKFSLKLVEILRSFQDLPLEIVFRISKNHVRIAVNFTIMIVFFSQPAFRYLFIGVFQNSVTCHLGIFAVQPWNTRTLVAW